MLTCWKYFGMTKLVYILLVAQSGHMADISGQLCVLRDYQRKYYYYHPNDTKYCETFRRTHAGRT